MLTVADEMSFLLMVKLQSRQSVAPVKLPLPTTRSCAVPASTLPWYS